MSEISIDEIRNALQKIKNGKSHVDDMLVLIAIKIGGNVFLAKMKGLFNLYLFTGMLPSH